MDQGYLPVVLHAFKNGLLCREAHHHAFVVKVFNRSMEECRYAKKMIGQFRKKLTSTPRTQGPDFCAFLIHCRVDAFLNAGYVYQREFEWR